MAYTRNYGQPIGGRLGRTIREKTNIIVRVAVELFIIVVASSCSSAGRNVCDVKSSVKMHRLIFHGLRARVNVNANVHLMDKQEYLATKTVSRNIVIVIALDRKIAPT